ncbi:MAG: DUF4492 domain-containing protein, partial [Bacteroidales bacterium]|nr:DUF4492 domain-containing protein [Bacteroidales bacterium]
HFSLCIVSFKSEAMGINKSFSDFAGIHRKMFALLKVFFFPDLLSMNFDTNKESGEYVFKELVKPIIKITNESD